MYTFLQGRQLIDVLCGEFYNMAAGFDEVRIYLHNNRLFRIIISIIIDYSALLFVFVKVSVLRAKKMLQSALLMNLESRTISFEDIGRYFPQFIDAFNCEDYKFKRQVLGHNKRYSAQDLCDKIGTKNLDECICIDILLITDAVSCDDVKRLGEKMLLDRPISVATLGICIN